MDKYIKIHCENVPKYFQYCFRLQGHPIVVMNDGMARVGKGLRLIGPYSFANTHHDAFKERDRSLRCFPSKDAATASNRNILLLFYIDIEKAG